MPSTLKRYKGKLAYLLKKYGDRQTAIKKARSYAGGKSKGKNKVNKLQFPDEFPFESFTACVERMNGEVDNPQAYCAAWVKHAKGHWPAEASEEAKQLLQEGGMGALNRFVNVVKLNEDVNEVEILRTGEWDHPQYGKIKITEPVIDNMIKNFYNNVRGVDLAVDQAHKPDDGAAGWFKELRKEDTGIAVRLMAKIEWTPTGKELIKSKIFRYFSPEFTFNYKDAETGNQIKNVLFGGALTNRPFIKGMAPVLLDEATAEEITNQEIALMENRIFTSGKSGNEPDNYNHKTEGGNDLMELKEIRELLQLSEDATEQEVVTALADSYGELKDVVSGLYEKLELSEEAGADEALQAIEGLNEKVKAKEDESQTLSERIATLEAQTKESNWEQLKTKAMSEGKLTAKQAEKFKPMYFKDPEGTKGIIEALSPVIDLSEHGSNQQSESSIELYESKIKEKMKDAEGLQYAEAARMVASENPDLWKKVDEERRH